MADFVVQSEVGVLENEEKIVLDLLDRNPWLHSYTRVSKYQSDLVPERGKYPVGEIDFVEGYLRKACGLERENPIEIPKYLRTEEFLKREYIITTSEFLPKSGKYFLKDVTQLKKFGEVIEADFCLEALFKDKEGISDYSLVLPKDHLYLVSSLYNIQSEYRVYVIGDEIEQICCYNGNCTIFPDVNLIKKAVALISINEKWLRSYTIDVMVGKEGTALIEVHNFTSVGLYSTLWGDNLLYAYRDGIDYLVYDNHLLER